MFNKENNNNFIVRHQVVTKGTFVLQVSYHSEVIFLQAITECRENVIRKKYIVVSGVSKSMYGGKFKAANYFLNVFSKTILKPLPLQLDHNIRTR